MSGPRRTKGETLPASSEVLDQLKRQTETKVPVIRQYSTPPNAHVVPSRRGNSAHSIVPPPPDREGEGDDDELVIEMSGDDDDDPQPRRSRSETLADPMTTEKLAESARNAPPPPAPTPAGPNRHVKRR